MLPVARADGLLKGGPSAFFRRRVRRILPPYYLALGLSLALMWLFLKHPMGGFGDGSRQITWAGVGAHMFLIHDVFPATASQMNPVFWSIAVEWRIYFAFPLLVWAWRRFGALATTLAALMIGYGLFAALASTPLNLAPWGMCPHYLGLFALGMLGAGITFSEAMVGLRQRVPWMVITLIGVPGLKLVPDQHWHGASLPFEVVDGYIGLWAMCLLVAAGRGENNPLRRILSWRPLLFLGTFAYSIYLMHVPFLLAVWQYGLLPLHLYPHDDAIDTNAHRRSRFSSPVLFLLSGL